MKGNKQSQNSHKQAQSSKTQAQSFQLQGQNSQQHGQISKKQGQNSQQHGQNSQQHRQNSQQQAQSSKQQNAQKYMLAAFKQALLALQQDEVPIGAVVVKDGKIISRGHNKRENSQNPIMHAEIIAITKAAKKLKSWRLDGCQMFVTLEPCPMCAGAISNARLEKVTYACKEKTSSDNLCEKILSSTRLNHKTNFFHDSTIEKECSDLLSQFFKSKRKNKDESLF